jgi:cell division protein FtsB
MSDPDDATTDQGLICALQTVERLQRELERLHEELEETKERIRKMDDRRCE